MLGLFNLVALIPGAGPVVAVIGSVVGAIVRCKPCLIVLAALALFIAGDIRGHHIERVKCSARIEKLKSDAAAAAAKRDADAKRELEQKFEPVVADLQRQADGLQQQVADYEKEKAARSGSCVLGSAANRLR